MGEGFTLVRAHPSIHTHACAHREKEGENSDSKTLFYKESSLGSV